MRRLLSFLLAVPVPLCGQQLTGRVVDASTGRTIPGAQVSLVDSSGEVRSSTASDGRGRFGVSLVRGDSVYVYVEALGYLAMVDGPLSAEGDTPLSVEFALRAVPLDVEGVVVTSERVPALDRVGFYERRASGAGYQLDNAFLERRGRPALVTEWLRGIPGVSIGNEKEIRLRGMSSIKGACPYRVFLDGILVVTDPFNEDENWPRDLVRPDDVEAIEVYTRPSEIPAQYGGAQGGCGVILIWSKR